MYSVLPHLIFQRLCLGCLSKRLAMSVNIGQFFSTPKWNMPNSCSSTLPSFNALDMLVSNTANANVMMSINFVTLASFFWCFLVSAVATPLTLAPARELAPREIFTMSVLSVATLDIPEAMLSLLEQEFSHVS